MRKLFLLSVAFIGFSAIGLSQTEDFQPKGKPFMKIFSNYHTTFVDGESASAFALDRLYLGYEYAFSENFSAKANFDIGDPGVGKLQMTAYVKNAYVKYKTSNLAVNFGLISTTQFKVQEDFWGYRYIEKSFQDAYKFNSSADLGINLAYKVNDMLSLDVIVANGEGYKSLQSDSIFRYGIGATIKPIKNLTARVYYDYTSDDVEQSSIAAFLGYKADNFSIGAEYNTQMNVGFSDGKDFSGTSIYGTFKTCKTVNVFGRYDMLTSNTLSGAASNWNNSKDGQLFIAGFEYAPVKGVKIAPNFKGWSPADDSKEFVSTFVLNCEFKF